MVWEKSLQKTIVPYAGKNGKVVFTIGYEKRKIDDFIKILKDRDIDMLVDVRANSYSRKPGFSHITLKSRLEDEEIDYVSMKKLGPPKKLRADLKEKGYGWFFKEYMKYLNKEGGELDKLEKIVKYGRCCLMCFELEPRECHRSMIANKLSEKGFEIIHL